jgi:hypothetical protein
MTVWTRDIVGKLRSAAKWWNKAANVDGNERGVSREEENRSKRGLASAIVIYGR